MSQAQSSSRPLAPAGTSESSRDSSFNGRASRDPSRSQTRATTKRNASIACISCRIAKRKCDQGNPCSNCSNSQKECVYDASQDGRRKEARKRRLDELEFRSNALDRLLLKLRNSTHAEARELIDLIKRDAPLEEILEFIEKHPGELAEETLRAISASPPPPEGAGIRRMLAISELIDTPTFQVQSGPWTEVTSDDAFVSNILSAYYNWYHFYYHNFDWALFLDAFNSKNLDSPYCTPFLVNAVLGMGSLYSDHPSACAIPGDTDSRGLHFYNEAERLYELEGDQVTLANVQGFTIMIMLAAFTGRDRVSTVSLMKLDVIVPQLLSQYSKANPELPIPEELQMSLRIAEWAAYTYSVGFGLGFMTVPSWSKPSLERPYGSDFWKTHLTPWSPYPLNQEPILLPQYALYDNLCEVYLFMGDVQSLLFINFPELNALQKLEAAREMDKRMQDWYSSLHDEHRFDHPSFIIVPGTVDIALTLFYTRLVLWHWVIPTTSPAQRSSPSPERYEPESSGPQKPSFATIENIKKEATEMCFQVVEATVPVIRRFDDQYGPGYFSMLSPQSGIYCVNFLLSGNLHSAHEEELLLQIMQILVQSSKRWQLVKGVTQMLLKVAEEKVKAQSSPLVERGDEESGGTPPGQITKEVFESMELIVKDMAWSPSDYLHFSSRYPNYMVAKEDTTTELSNMLERWAQLALDEIALRDAEESDVGQAQADIADDVDITGGAPLQSIESEDVLMVGGDEEEALAASEQAHLQDKEPEGEGSTAISSSAIVKDLVEEKAEAMKVTKPAESKETTDIPESSKDDRIAEHPGAESSAEDHTEQQQPTERTPGKVNISEQGQETASWRATSSASPRGDRSRGKLGGTSAELA